MTLSMMFQHQRHLKVFSKKWIPLAHPEISSYHIWHSVSLSLKIQSISRDTCNVQPGLGTNGLPLASETLLAFNFMSLFYPGSSKIWKSFFFFLPHSPGIEPTPQQRQYQILNLLVSSSQPHSQEPLPLFPLSITFILFPIYSLPEEINLLSFNEKYSQIYVFTSFEL